MRATRKEIRIWKRGNRRFDTPLNLLKLATEVTHERCHRLKNGRADRERNFYLFAVGIGIGIGIENGVDRVNADAEM